MLYKYPHVSCEYNTAHIKEALVTHKVGFYLSLTIEHSTQESKLQLPLLHYYY